MSVMTVLGPVAAEDLGVVLPHEHLLIDLRNQFVPFGDPEKDRVSRQKVSVRNLGRLRRNPYAVRDNLVLDEIDVIEAELLAFKDLGGQTVVECTSVGIGRNARALRALAERTGLHVIGGCGYYTQDTHPPELRLASTEDIATRMLVDLTEGMDGTAIRAGVIGEIGTSDPIHADELKVLEAAALAHREVLAPIYVHTYPWGTQGLRAADSLMAHGVSPQKTVICHVDVEPDLAHLRELLKRGVTIEFDNFGKEFQIDPEEAGFAGGGFISDLERVRLIKRLLDEGYGGQLLVTNDICLKCMLRHYGGRGYGHILEDVVPMLLAEGVDSCAVDLLVKDNPRRLLGGEPDATP